MGRFAVHFFNRVSLLADIKDVFKPFVQERSLKGFLALFPGCSRYHFWECSLFRVVDWVVETKLKVSQGHMEALKDVLEVKDLIWTLLAALIAPRGKNLHQGILPEWMNISTLHVDVERVQLSDISHL